MSNGRECQCGQVHRACDTEFQYAAKVVCGRVAAGPAGAATPVAPGQYWTAVNIHNPSKCQGARLRWKVAVGGQGVPGFISTYRNLRELGPDAALELDCRQIMSALLPPVPPFVKGYIVIESDVELDVVSVYTTAQTPTGALNSFHTERVPPRCIPVCEDLVLPLNTGVAAWQTVAPTPGALGPVALLFHPVPVATPPFGSSYVSQNSTDWQPATSPGPRTYELCFDLCYGFAAPAAFPIQMLVDDTATVQLNGNLVGNVPFNTLTTLNVNPAFLRVGRNCFRVVVTNTVGNTMFALAGLLRVGRGRCPCSPLPLVGQGRGGVQADGVEAAAGELEESSGAGKAGRRASKQGQGRKRGGTKKAGGKK